VDFRTIEHAGQRFVVAQAGEGPDIVLLHGFPDTPYSWTEISDALVADGWRVSVAWLRGYHPDTIVPGRPYDPETIGRDALGLIDALGLSRPVLFGHDWGALITYVAAALEPQRVRAIVTSGIPHPSVLRRTPQALWAVRHFFALKMPWAPWHCRRDDFAYLDVLYRRWSPDWSGPEREATLRHAKEALARQATLDGSISYYRCLPLRPSPVTQKVGAVPGLIIGGEHALGQEKMFAATAALMPGPSRALIVKGAGHWPHRENSSVVIPELLAFLSELDG